MVERKYITSVKGGFVFLVFFFFLIGNTLYSITVLNPKSLTLGPHLFLPTLLLLLDTLSLNSLFHDSVSFAII